MSRSGPIPDQSGADPRTTTTTRTSSMAQTSPGEHPEAAVELLTAALTTARWPDGSLMVDVDAAILRRQVVAPVMHQLHAQFGDQLTAAAAIHVTPPPRHATALASRRRRPKTPGSSDRRNGTTACARSFS